MNRTSGSDGTGSLLIGSTNIQILLGVILVVDDQVVRSVEPLVGFVEGLSKL